MSLLETGLTLALGGGAATMGQLGLQWLKDRAASRTSDRSADVQIEEHRDGLTLDLLRAALTGLQASPGPFEVAAVLALGLGKGEILSRLEAAIKRL